MTQPDPRELPAAAELNNYCVANWDELGDSARAEWCIDVRPILAAADLVDPARLALALIRELHQSYRIEYEPTQDGDSYSWPLCKHCHVRYPCPTVAILDAAEGAR